MLDRRKRQYENVWILCKCPADTTPGSACRLKGIAPALDRGLGRFTQAPGPLGHPGALTIFRTVVRPIPNRLAISERPTRLALSRSTSAA
jgi:hypothetical protein